MVYDNAKVSDWVKVYNDAQVYGEAKVYNFTKIGGEAKVYDNAKVYDYADVRDNAKVYGNAEVSKKTKMYGFTEVGGDIKIIDNVEVKENSENETKKYELTDNTIEQNGRTLYQIRALKDFEDVMAGDLGGYIEKEENLSQEGNCWVSDKARVYDNAKVSGSAKVYDEAQVFGKAEVYGKAEVFGKAQVFGNTGIYNEAKVYDNALVFGKTEVYDNAQIYGYAQVYGNAKVYEQAQVYGESEVYDNAIIYNKAQVGDNAKVFGKAQVYGNAKVFEYTEISDDTKIIDNTIIENSKEIKVENVKKDFILENDFNLENEIQKYEEHCSKVVDKLKLQDELPNFQVISQKGVLYEKNSENNNITEIKNFVENLKGEEFWDNMSLKDIRNWKELRNDEVVSIVYESKDDRDNITLEEFTDYNDYAKDTVKNALEKEFKNNPDTIESLKKDILDKVPNKEVVKEKVEVVKDIEKEEKATNKTFGYRGDF